MKDLRESDGGEGRYGGRGWAKSTVDCGGDI